MTERSPVRTLLFVPANRPERMAKALTLATDAVVFDLESAIPGAAVAEARTMVAEVLVERGSERPSVFVRVNSEPDRLADDLDAVVGPALDAVLVPQIVGPDDVRRVDDELAARETDRGLAVGHTAIMPLVETASAVRSAYEIATASPRVAYMGGATSRGGDLARSVGYRWTPAGDETAYLRSKVLIDVRAAGVTNPLSGLWGTIDDLAGLADFAERTRDLGYEGMMVIHPSHLAIVNAAFTPTVDEIAEWQRILAAMAEAEAAGSGAIRLDGRLIDVAHVHTARRELARAERLGVI